jgi:imidazolonepropionase-like amidohydrolase
MRAKGTLDLAPWTLFPLESDMSGVTRLGLIALLLLAACTPRTKDRIALVGGNVIPGDGKPVLRDAVVVVYQGRIETVAPREGFKIPKSAEQVDVTGSWIIPGLIDGEARAAGWAMSRYVAAGVTALRDAGSQMDSILALRELVSLGGEVAPRIYSAGAMIDGSPSADTNAAAVRTADQARRAVDARAVKPVDYIKIGPRITPELLKPIIDETGTFNLKLTAHLGLIDAVSASRAGVHAIEYLSGIPEAASGKGAEKIYAEHRAGFYRGWKAAETAWARLDSTSLTNVANALAESRTVLVPSLIVHELYSRLDDPALMSGGDFASMPDSQVKAWDLPGFRSRTGWTDADLLAFRASRANQELFLRAFRAAGGTIVAGSDASSPLLVPGWSLHTELELLVNAGLTPKDAIATATSNVALLLGADSIGVVSPGKVADMVVLKSNPLLDIRNTRTIQRVMVRGQLYKADSLRSGF